MKFAICLDRQREIDMTSEHKHQKGEQKRYVFIDTQKKADSTRPHDKELRDKDTRKKHNIIATSTKTQPATGTTKIKNSIT